MTRPVTGTEPIEVRDVAASIGKRRMEFPAQAVFQRKFRIDLEVVLQVQSVVPGQAVVVLFHGSVAALVGQAQQQIAQIPPGESAVVGRVPVIVASLKA
jgi:hypothetical protein